MDSIPEYPRDVRWAPLALGLLAGLLLATAALALGERVCGREARLTAYRVDGVIENAGVLGPVSAATG